MCAMSYVGDYWKERVGNTHPWIQPYVVPFPLDEKPVSRPSSTKTVTIGSEVSKEEFEALKKEVEELKKLLLAAKEFDKKTNQPDCELDEKVALIKKVAELVGVDMKDVFDK